MPNSTLTRETPQQAAAAFDELIWSLVGEMAADLPEDSLTNAPFIDLEPDPEPAVVMSEASHSARRPWISTAITAVLVGAFGFALGQGGPGSDAEVAMLAPSEMIPEQQFELEDRPRTIYAPAERVTPAHATNRVIIVDPVIGSEAAEAVEIVEPKVAPKKTRTKRRSKPTPTKKLAPNPSVSFEDL